MTSRPAGRGWQVDEAARAATIAALDLDMLRRNDALRAITDFAAALCDTPVALVSLVGEAQQTFLSRTGTDVEGTARDISFCQFAMLGDDVMVVPDLSLDPRFADNPLVTGDLHLRFYAGAPLATDDGVPLGAVCVLSPEARPAGLTPLQRQGLLTLAASVMARLRDTSDASAWRHAENDTRRRLGDSESRFHTLADAMPQMVWSTLPDGFHDYYNARWYEFTGVPPGSTDGEGWNGMFHPDDQDRAWATWRCSLATGEPYQIEYRLRHADGSYRWVLGRALPIRDDAGRITRWFGTCTDIHEQKIAAEEREVVSQELAHRIKNIFAVISGLISFAGRGRPAVASAMADLRERVTALGRAHDFVRPHGGQSHPGLRHDSLHGLLSQLFEPYQQGGRRLAITGEDVPIDDRSATPLALLFHELATNAVKYGALSSATGCVDVTTERQGDDLVLVWLEQNGPRVVPPTGDPGFGSQLIELSAVRQLGGVVSRDWRAEGLLVTIRTPASAFSRR